MSAQGSSGVVGETGRQSRSNSQRPAGRALTDKRRAQNKDAQRRYREKQKLHIQALESLVSSRSASIAVVSQPRTCADTEESLAHMTPSEEANIPLPDTDLHPPANLESFSEIDSFHPNRNESDIFEWVDTTQSDMSITGEVDPSFLSLEQPLSLNLAIQYTGNDSALQKPSHAHYLGDQSNPQSSVSPYDIPLADQKEFDSSVDLPGRDITTDILGPSVFCGITIDRDINFPSPSQLEKNHQSLGLRLAFTSHTAPVLVSSYMQRGSEFSGSSATSPYINQRLPSSQSRLPDIYRNNFRINRFCLWTASLANAALLGVSAEIAKSPNFMSVFYRQNLQNQDVSIVKRSLSHLKKALQPCTAQITNNHPFWMDVFPFPDFRERAIILSSQLPKVFDESELASDLDNDGLICWGSTSGMEIGSPWDMRSWEAQPWFLNKWWMLTGGEEGAMSSQSRWWREMRGEE